MDAETDCQSVVNAMTILDFDDTIICSAWIQKFLNVKSGLNINANIEFLQSVDKAASSLLYELSLVSTVIIISNAQMNWIIYCLRELFPRVRTAVEICEIEVISARDNFCSRYSDPIQWKFASFRDKINFFVSRADCVNPLLICIGDGILECLVAVLLCENSLLSYAVVKFIENPSPIQLCRELNISKRLVNTILKKYPFDISTRLALEIVDNSHSECCVRSALFTELKPYLLTIRKLCDENLDNILALPKDKIEQIYQTSHLFQEDRLRHDNHQKDVPRNETIFGQVASSIMLLLYFIFQYRG